MSKIVAMKVTGERRDHLGIENSNFEHTVAHQIYGCNTTEVAAASAPCP